MSESTLPLLLALTVGLPCTLLALAIIYHARVAGRLPDADAGWDPAEADGAPLAFSLPLAPPDPDPALLELQRTVGELQGQLARQRAALTALMSEHERPAVPVALPEPVPAAAGAPATPPGADAGDLRGAVQRLSAEGLSERAIARRLHVGLEEVRLASRRRERVS